MTERPIALDALIAETLAENQTPGKPMGEILEAVSAKLGLNDEQDRILWPLLRQEVREVLHMAAIYLTRPQHDYAGFVAELRSEIPRAAENDKLRSTT
jgi:hypothetical protein